ncbi:hypothetical protein BJ165DRAFT_1527794 [Panaeolus papilionaceus]|nr:hypothetical protein BJ165DRAFT_1527794 [Panaeolus papilionaceus]
MSAHRSAILQTKQDTDRSTENTESATTENVTTVSEEVASTTTTRGQKRSSGDDSMITQSASKRRKNTQERQAFRLHLDLPGNLLPEILGHVNPIDLLNLSRTSKVLRRLLMSPGSRDIWVRALANLSDIPKCPNGIPEPRFVEFLWGTGCMACGKRIKEKKGHEISDTCTRLCPKCLPIHFERIKNWDIFVPSKAYPAHIVECLDTYEYYDLETSNFVFADELWTSRSQDKQWTEEYLALTTPNAKADWENRIVGESEARKVLSRKINSWLIGRASDRSDAKKELETEGKRRILTHLEIMGWGEEIKGWGRTGFEARGNEIPEKITKAVKKEITPRILKNMEPFLNQYMEMRKKERLFDEHRAVLTSRARTLTLVCEPLIEKLIPASEIRIRAPDVYHFPRVKDFLVNTPQHVKLESKDFAFVEGLLPEIIQAWKERIESDLISLIRDAMGEEYITDVGQSNVLSLATSVFSCQGTPPPPMPGMYEIKAFGLDAFQRKWTNHCQVVNESIWLEDALDHRCCYRRRRSDEEPKTLTEFIFDTEPWSNKLVFKAEDSNILDKALLVCRRDPMTTTVEDMDELDPIFECVLCRRPRQGREVMNWRGVVQHFRLRHKNHRCPQPEYLPLLALVVLRGTEAEEARKLIAQAREKKIYNTELEVLCMHCDHTGRLAPLKRHLLQVHNISNSKEGVDLRLSGKNPNCYPTESVQLWSPYLGRAIGSVDKELEEENPLTELRREILGPPMEEDEERELRLW